MPREIGALQCQREVGRELICVLSPCRKTCRCVSSGACGDPVHHQSYRCVKNVAQCKKKKTKEEKKRGVSYRKGHSVVLLFQPMTTWEATIIWSRSYLCIKNSIELWRELQHMTDSHCCTGWRVPLSQSARFWFIFVQIPHIPYCCQKQSLASNSRTTVCSSAAENSSETCCVQSCLSKLPSCFRSFLKLSSIFETCFKAVR